MAGYFNDGDTVDVELGEHVPAMPTISRRNIVLGPHDEDAEILPSGGGIYEVEVRGQRLRHNLGDAERYVYGLFRQLARSGPGDLGAEDVTGRQVTFGDAVCVQADAEVHAFTFVDMRFVFLAAEQSSAPAWGAIPSTPALYAGTSTAQDYAAGGITVGDAPYGLRIEMTRRSGMRQIPRARGARATMPHSGAHLVFTVLSAQVGDAEHVANDLEDLARDIGADAQILSGNGVDYTNCTLDRIEPEFTDSRAARFEARFLKEI